MLLRVTNLENSLILHRVVHHGAFIDHFSSYLEPDIESDARVRVHIQVHIFELEPVVKSALLKRARPIKITSQLDEFIFGSSCDHSAH